MPSILKGVDMNFRSIHEVHPLRSDLIQQLSVIQPAKEFSVGRKNWSKVVGNLGPSRIRSSVGSSEKDNSSGRVAAFL